MGALDDSWVVRIIHSGWKDNTNMHWVSSHTRDFMYTLYNILLITKIVIHASYCHKGGSHNSSYFRDTNLRTKVYHIKDRIYELGYFRLSNSAYSLILFLIVHYNFPNSKRPNDESNFSIQVYVSLLSVYLVRLVWCGEYFSKD